MKSGSYFLRIGLWIGMACAAWATLQRSNAQSPPPDALSHGSMLVTNAFRGWLSSVSSTVVVDLQQEGLTPACRDESGGLFEALLDELLDARLTVHLSPHLVQTELEYYQANRATETNLPVADGVTKVLERARSGGEIDWSRLRELHSAAPDADVVTRHLPWLSVAPRRPEPRLGSVEQAAKALLIVKLRWSGIPMRGAVVNPKHRRGTPGTFSGRTMLWKFEGELCLEQFGAPRVRLTYPAPAWKSDYDGVASRPLYIGRQALLNDIKMGAAHSPASTKDPLASRNAKGI